MFEFINTVLLLILVNAKVPEMNVPDNFPILSGRFADFNVAWYRNVGTTIMLTMLINIVMPPLVDNLAYLFTLYKRCRDRSCTRDAKKTKQVLQEDYNELYSGDEFLIEVRYAQVLSAFLITMMFSAGMPGLYLVMFL
jgi:hypothetical protein